MTNKLKGTSYKKAKKYQNINLKVPPIYLKKIVFYFRLVVLNN